jgi:Na+-driven multidrug efflux pump
LFISGVINVLFDFLFVRFGGMDVAGVGIATVISEVVSAVLALLFLFLRKTNYVCLHWKKLHIDRESLLEIIRIGLPAGLQGFFFALPNVFVQSKLYTIEPGNLDLSNGAIASGQIESYIFAGIQAISSACLAFTAANHGALRKDNIKKVWLYSFFLILIYTGICDILILTVYRPLFLLFVSSETAVEYGRQRLWVIGLTYTLDGVMDIFASALRGMKKSTYPMVVTLLFCTIVRIVFLMTLFNLDFFHNVGWLYAVFPISWVLAIIFNGLGLILFTPKVFRQIDEDKEKASEAVAQNA